MFSRHSVTCTHAARSFCCWLCSLDSSHFNCSVKAINSVAWLYTASTLASGSVSGSEDSVGDRLTVLDEDVLERPAALQCHYVIIIISTNARYNGMGIGLAIKQWQVQLIVQHNSGQVVHTTVTKQYNFLPVNGQ